MAKTTITFSLDIEASGPIPGPWWMCSFGLCRTDDVQVGIRKVLRPMVNDLSQPDSPDAMRVVAKGVPGFTWDEDAGEEANVDRLRAWFEDHGEDAPAALKDTRRFIADQTGENRAVLVGSPVTFDFLWLYWYWWWLLREMPPFGFSGLDIRSYFMGMHGVGFLGTGKQRYLKHYPNDFAHTHDPLDDARQQGAIWRDMCDQRKAWKELQAGGEGGPDARR